MSVSGRYHQDRAVHLRRTGDHVLDVVRVSRAVNVCVVTVGRLVLNVRGRNRDTACLFFRRVVDLIEGLDFTALQFRHNLRQCRRQGRLAVIDVTDSTHVDVRFVSFKFYF